MGLRIPNLGWNRNFKLLAVTIFFNGIAFGIQRALFNNFLVDRFLIEADKRGLLEAVREIPGFFNVIFIALIIHFAPPIVGGISLVIMGIGLIAYGKVSTVFGLYLCILLWSVGFHSWFTLRQTMTLRFSGDGEKGRRLGQIRSLRTIALLVGAVMCMLLVNFDYGQMFTIAGCSAIIGGIFISFASWKKPVKRENGFVFRRRYGLYYVLHFLQGCRKTVFVAFALFAFVRIHGMPKETIIKLVLASRIVVIFTSPFMGRFVDRYGERRIMQISFAGLIFVFLGYAFINVRPLLYVLFCTDAFLFITGMAMTTYVHRITPEEELKPTISMGVTINHIACVALSIIGGLVWHNFGYQVVFLLGSGLMLISLILSSYVDPDRLLASEEEILP